MRGTPSTKTKSTGPKWDESKKFIRQEAAAERWDVSVDTIRRMISSGKITGYRLRSCGGSCLPTHPNARRRLPDG